MKLHKHLVQATAVALKEIFTEKRYADRVLERTFKQNPKWGSRDRRMVAESVYDIVRYYRLYSELAGSKNNYWFMMAIWLVVHDYELPAWQEFVDVHPEAIKKHKAKLETNAVIAQSFPDWLWELGARELTPAVWEQEATAMNEQARVFLRVNTLKATPEKVIASLAKDRIVAEAVLGINHALVLKNRANIFKTEAFSEGWIEVQDAGSQQIGLFLAPHAGEVVVDACAGAGGKSLQLAALMQNKGRIVSMDVEQWKLDELKKRAKRAGVHQITTRLIEKDTIASMKNSADKVLLDVPCSGSGVFRRNPDAKWKLSEESLERTKSTQNQILNEYSGMVKPGGTLVYSTCSVFPSENENQVNAFLESHPEFKLLKDSTLLPSSGFDGFYMALLVKSPS
jgi:16S rRNA (cytosine967-C5)-methyltransferase